MRLADIGFAAIDFESAGSDRGLTDEPVQIAVAHLRDGRILPGFTTYLKPSRPVTWAARSVHGITDEMLADSPRLADIWPTLRSNLQGCWVVAHGASTERRFLRVFPMHGFGPWIDTLQLARALCPGLASHALSDVVAALGLSRSPELSAQGFRWHDAASDALASLVLLRDLIQRGGFTDGAELLSLSGGSRRPPRAAG